MYDKTLQGLKNFLRYQTTIYLSLICLVTVVLVGKNISDEEVIDLEGDMPRYLMNGVYLLDVLRDFPLGNFLEYSTAYYARYPALSIGHHPPLTGLAEVPVYAVFGISVVSGKLTILLFVLLGSIMWYRLIQSLYDENTALFSTLLFITTPFIVGFATVVMSEMPALALLITASYYFHQYLNDEKRKHLILFIASFVLSIYAKQTAIILGLVFALQFVGTKGFRKVFTQDIMWAGLAFSIAMIPIGVMTLNLSPENIHFVTRPHKLRYYQRLDIIFYYAGVLWTHHLTPPVLFLSLVGIALGLWKRDRRCYFFLAWIIIFYFVLTYAGTATPRYVIFWIPAFCLMAASIVNYYSSLYWKVGMATVFLIISGFQLVIAYNLESNFARGYKEAAQYVVDNKKGEAILYSAYVDTGYFIFHIRAADSDRKMIVLRADKLLATSFLFWNIDDRIKDKSDIFKVLNDFGVCHVVLEDQHFSTRSLEWLREELQKDQFVLKKTIPILSRDKRLEGISLKIYEYKSCGPPNPDAVLDMNLPIINRSIKLKFDKLVKGL